MCQGWILPVHERDGRADLVEDLKEQEVVHPKVAVLHHLEQRARAVVQQHEAVGLGPCRKRGGTVVVDQTVIWTQRQRRQTVTDGGDGTWRWCNGPKDGCTELCRC